MTNDFDFYFIEVTAKRKRDLYKLGIKKENISSRLDGYKIYGRPPYIKKYPVYIYVAMVWVSGIMQGITVDKARKEAETVKKEWEKKGANAYIKYHIDD